EERDARHVLLLHRARPRAAVQRAPALDSARRGRALLLHRGHPLRSPSYQSLQRSHAPAVRPERSGSGPGAPGGPGAVSDPPRQSHSERLATPPDHAPVRIAVVRGCAPVRLRRQRAVAARTGLRERERGCPPPALLTCRVICPEARAGTARRVAAYA